MYGCCKAADHAASGESVLCLVLGNRRAFGGHAHRPQGEPLQHSPFYDSLDDHGWLDDLPEGMRSRLRLVFGDACDASRGSSVRENAS
jgi:hypothetical protein